MHIDLILHKQVTDLSLKWILEARKKKKKKFASYSNIQKHETIMWKTNKQKHQTTSLQGPDPVLCSQGELCHCINWHGSWDFQHGLSTNRMMQKVGKAASQPKDTLALCS